MSDRPPLSKLESSGLGVVKFSFYHYRVAGRFDVYPNEHGRDWRWHDLVTNLRGECDPRKLPDFVPGFLAANPEPVRIAEAVTEPGWWNCPLAGCAFKMREDDSPEFFKRQMEHYDQHESKGE